jgi:hypothetical protein
LDVLVLGAPGQGKTSVLHQLELGLRDGEAQRRAVFVDLAAASSVDAALQLLVSVAAEAGGEALQWTPQVPLPDEGLEESRTRTWLSQLLRLPPCTFLMDNVGAESVGFALFGTFRDRLWETSHHGCSLPIAWGAALAAASAGGFVLGRGDGELDYSQEAAHDLLVRRLGGDPAWTGAIVENVGTNPRQLLRAALANLAPPSASTGDAQAASGGGLAEWEAWHRRVAQLDRRPSPRCTTRPPSFDADRRAVFASARERVG